MKPDWADGQAQRMCEHEFYDAKATWQSVIANALRKTYAAGYRAGKNDACTQGRKKRGQE